MSEGEEWYLTVKPKDGIDLGTLVKSNVVRIRKPPTPVGGIAAPIDKVLKSRSLRLALLIILPLVATIVFMRLKKK